MTWITFSMCLFDLQDIITIAYNKPMLFQILSQCCYFENFFAKGSALCNNLITKIAETLICVRLRSCFGNFELSTSFEPLNKNFKLHCHTINQAIYKNKQQKYRNIPQRLLLCDTFLAVTIKIKIILQKQTKLYTTTEK